MTARLAACAGILCLSVVQVISLSVFNVESKPGHDRAVACYVSTWATYRKGQGKFDIDDIDPSQCTHLIYAFAGLDSTNYTIRSLDPYNDLEDNYGKGSYKKMTALRKRYPHLTVSIAIGGWNEGSRNYSILAADQERRRTFVDSVVKFLRKYDFNGFDLDWEFPTKREGAPEDKANFVLLVKELYEAMKPEGWSLTAALGAGKDTMESAYDLKELNKYLDHVHLMCYDYHGKWDLRTGANAPLRSSDPNDVNTVEYSVNYMLKNGIKPSKLLLGLPLYGRTFQVIEESEGEMLGAAANATAFSGPYTNEDGFIGYNEICDELHKAGSTWQKMWDVATSTPFARNGKQVIVYDDKDSLEHKVKFAMEKSLGGVMIWSIDIDDFKGECEEDGGKQPFHLLSSINTAIISSLQSIEEKEKEKEKDREETKDGNGSSTIPMLSTGLLLAPAVVLSLWR